MNTRNTLASVFVALLLVACGGGDAPDDDGRATPQPVDCKATPELCV